MSKTLMSWLLVLLQGSTVVNSWNNNIGEPKRQTGSLAGNFRIILSEQKTFVTIGASYVLGKLVLGDPKASLAAELLADVAAPSMLKQRALSLDSQAYQPGIKLKDVYYPVW
jgi:hypothetical protein